MRIFVFDSDGESRWFDVRQTTQDWYASGTLQMEDAHGRPIGATRVLSLLPDQTWVVWLERDDVNNQRGRLLSASEAIDWLLQHDYEPPADIAEELLGKPVAPDKRETPAWNAGMCELSFRGEVIRSIRPLAKNPITILSAFEEEEWPRRILSPLSPKDNLHEAIRTLNKGLDSIEFKADGTCEGVVWATCTV